MRPVLRLGDPRLRHRGISVPEDDFSSARLEALLTDLRDTIACTTPMHSASATPSVPPVDFEATGAAWRAQATRTCLGCQPTSNTEPAQFSMSVDMGSRSMVDEGHPKPASPNARGGR